MDHPCNLVKRKKTSGFIYQHHRASPHLLSKCIQKLKPQQVEEVKELGFQKMLNFAMNGVPHKLAYFLLDKFDDKLMHIDLGQRKIEVNCDAIHQLLGIPNKGTDLQTIPKLDKMTSFGKKWKDRYPGLITRAMIVQMIQNSNDDENSFFTIDFIVLFISSIISCRTNGHCKTGLLRKISEDLELKDINWCKFVLDKLRGCKKGWKRNPNYQFSGAITILTLIYVDSISCNGINEIRTMDPISFWTMENLSRREELEMKAGGFGLGEYRGLFEHRDISNQEKISNIEKEIEAFLKAKTQLEQHLKDVIESNIEHAHVARLVVEYDKIWDNKINWKVEKNELFSDLVCAIQSTRKGASEATKTLSSNEPQPQPSNESTQNRTHASLVADELNKPTDASSVDDITTTHHDKVEPNEVFVEKKMEEKNHAKKIVKKVRFAIDEDTLEVNPVKESVIQKDLQAAMDRDEGIQGGVVRRKSSRVKTQTSKYTL
ncbi:hypothetical protein R6Q59_030533 [Mikania micrantha]